MFSEYASRFLQNSTIARTPADHSPDRPLDRRRYAPPNAFNNSRGNPRNPYQLSASQSQSRFPFASRLSRQQQPQPHAPLFYSAIDDFHDDDQEDEGEEHERHVADLYALQHSRQHFAPSNLTESSEMDDEGVAAQNHDREHSHPRGRAQGPRTHPGRDESLPDSEASAPSSKGKGKLVDVDLASTVHDEPPDSLAHLAPIDSLDDPPPFRAFKSTAPSPDSHHFMPFETDQSTEAHMPHPPSPDRESNPATVILPSPEPPRHDAFWGKLFNIALFAMFAAFVLIWFNTTTPSTPLGDTVFSALRASTSLLAWDTFIAVLVALLWLALLRSYVRTLVFALLVAVPVVLCAFSLYPLVASFRGAHNGNSYQDRAMRWLSPVPAILAALWTWNVIRARHSLARSVDLLEFATRILTASPYLVVLGFATLTTTVLFTWLWLLMFERIFLSGHFSSGKNSTKTFLLDANSWWLGAAFILQYLWTLSVLAGLQRATSAATVSQWYFHRFAVPQPSSAQVVRASFSHAAGTQFGTICLATLLTLLIRLPLLLLPARLSALLNMCFYAVVPASFAALTNPLALTYAAIHSQPLGIAARGLAPLRFDSPRAPGARQANSSDPTPTTPAAAASTTSTGGLQPYRLAKLLLLATRSLMSLSLGMAGWVRSAHDLSLPQTSSGSAGGGAGVRGSLYAYMVGLMAAAIGYAVLGAVEEVVGGVLDASLVCWGSETGGGRAGLGGRFCPEAGGLFAGEGDGEGIGERGRGRGRGVV